jgi:hypothetical protein
VSGSAGEQPHDPGWKAPATPRPAGAATVETVEQMVRDQLAKALGGRRGVIESAAPMATFTLTYVITHELKVSLIAAISFAAALLLLRLAQRSSPQFVLNSFFGILLAALFASRSGKAEDAFLPGIMYNAIYSVALVLSIVLRWPVVGFMVGALTGDPTGWRSDPAMLRLCSRLTWLLALPCILRVLVQYPLYKAGEVGWLGTSKIVLGWPLQVATFVAMGALLARGRTPTRSGADGS